MAGCYKTLFISTVLSLMLTACGGGGGGSEAASTPAAPAENSAPQISAIEMVLNKQYSVSSGDEISKSVADSTIRIEQDTADSTTYATLLSGAAQLKRATQ